MGKREEKIYKICLANRDNQQSNQQSKASEIFFFFYSINFTSWLNAVDAIATAGVPLWLTSMGISVEIWM